MLGSPTCAFNIQVVRGLYGSLGAISAIFLVLSIIYVLQIQAHQRRKDPILFCLLATCLLGSAIGPLLFGFYRTVWPEATLGTDIYFSITHGVAFATSCVHVGLYYYSLAVLVFREARAFGNDIDDSALAFLWKFLIFHSLFVLVASCLPLVLLAQTPDVFDVIPPLYLGMYCTICMYISVICAVILAGMAKTIRKAIGAEQTSEQAALNKTLSLIDQLASSALSSGAIMGTILIAFASWTQLRIVGFTYLLPVLGIISLSVVLVGIIGLINTDKLKHDIERLFSHNNDMPNRFDNNAAPLTAYQNDTMKTSTVPMPSSGVHLASTLDHT